MLRCVRVTRNALFYTTALRLSGPSMAPKGAATKNTVGRDATADAVMGPSVPNKDGVTALRHVDDVVDDLRVQAQHRREVERQQTKFLFQGRRGRSSPEYYVARGNTGHPDPVAELLCAGRADPEWMWLKLLCFLCVSATFGTTIYGYVFAEHVKYFKDEPWSPFTY